MDDDLAVDPGHIGLLHGLQVTGTLRANDHSLTGRYLPGCAAAAGSLDLRRTVQDAEDGAVAEAANGQPGIGTEDAPMRGPHDQEMGAKALAEQDFAVEEANFAGIGLATHIERSAGVEQQAGLRVDDDFFATGYIGVVIGHQTAPRHAIIDQARSGDCQEQDGQTIDETAAAAPLRRREEGGMGRNGLAGPRTRAGPECRRYGLGHGETCAFPARNQTARQREKAIPGVLRT